MEHSSIEERNACDAAQRLVSMLCERLCSAWGSSAVVSAANRLRYTGSWFLVLAFALVRGCALYHQVLLRDRSQIQTSSRFHRAYVRAFYFCAQHREESAGSETKSSVEAWATTLGRCLVTSKENTVWGPSLRIGAVTSTCRPSSSLPVVWIDTLPRPKEKHALFFMVPHNIMVPIVAASRANQGQPTSRTVVEVTKLSDL